MAGSLEISSGRLGQRAAGTVPFTAWRTNLTSDPLLAMVVSVATQRSEARMAHVMAKAKTALLHDIGRCVADAERLGCKGIARSEERRVGKEGRFGWSA